MEVLVHDVSTVIYVTCFTHLGGSVPQSPIDAYHSPGEVYASGSQSRTNVGASVSPGGTAQGHYSRSTSRRNSQPQGGSVSSRGNGERKTIGWQTLVLYAVNLQQLDVHVNMSNVMGNTV